MMFILEYVISLYAMLNGSDQITLKSVSKWFALSYNGKYYTVIIFFTATIELK